MLPLFTRFLKKTDIKDISFLYVLKYLLIDVLELIILLYYKVPISFIIGISLQIFFDILFFIIFSITINNVNFISSASTSDTNSPHSAFRSKTNSEDSQKYTHSDKSDDNEKLHQLQLDDYALQPLGKIDEKILTNLIDVRLDISFEELNSMANDQHEIIRKSDLRFEELNDKPSLYMC